MKRSRQKERPGVMLYFDTICPALARLTAEQGGMLLNCIITYARTGDLTPLDDTTGLAFAMLQPSIDRDAERYEDIRVHGLYMVYCRRCKESGETPVSEDEYREQLTVANSNNQLPTTSTSTTTSPSTYPSTTTSPSTSSTGKERIGKDGGCKGEGKPGLKMPTPLSETEEQKRRAEYLQKLEQYK